MDVYIIVGLIVHTQTSGCINSNTSYEIDEYMT